MEVRRVRLTSRQDRYTGSNRPLPLKVLNERYLSPQAIDGGVSHDQRAPRVHRRVTMRLKHARVPEDQKSAILNADDNDAEKEPNEVKVRRRRLVAIETAVEKWIVSTAKQKGVQRGHSDYQVIMRKAFNEMRSEVKAHSVGDVVGSFESDEFVLSRIANHEREHDNAREDSSPLCAKHLPSSFGRPPARLSQSSPSRRESTQAVPIIGVNQELLGLGYEADAGSDAIQQWVENGLSVAGTHR